MEIPANIAKRSPSHGRTMRLPRCRLPYSPMLAFMSHCQLSRMLSWTAMLPRQHANEVRNGCQGGCVRYHNAWTFRTQGLGSTAQKAFLLLVVTIIENLDRRRGLRLRSSMTMQRWVGLCTMRLLAYLIITRDKRLNVSHYNTPVSQS